MKKSLYLFLGAVFVASVVWAARYPLDAETWLGTGAKQKIVQFAIRTASAGASAAFVPGVDNTNALGTSSLRFSNVFSELGNFEGPITGAAGMAVIVSTAPRTAAAVASLYSAYTIPAGTVYYNSTSGVMCVSSGTVQTSITVSTGTGACPS